MDGTRPIIAPTGAAAPLFNESGKSEHIPALDGVRGLAILMVMVCHFTIIDGGMLIDRMYGSAGRFGWAGIDLFFVLSGFLITGILLASKGETHYYRDFYARRILRIFPLYYIVVALALYVLPMSGDPHFHPFSGKESLLYWTYLSNLSNMFGTGRSNDAVAVTWTLAIEEQFYMVWPLVIFFCQPRTLKRLCIGLLAGALVLRMVFLSLNFESVHIAVAGLAPCRFDGIALGSLLALLVRERGIAGIRTTLMPYVPWVAAVSVLVIAIACAASHDDLERRAGPDVRLQLRGDFMFLRFLWALTSTENQWIGWIFTRPWLRFFGRYSYALYLFHLPVSRFIQDYVYGRPQLLQFHGSRIPGEIIFSLISGAISLVLALLSWNLVEKHFLALKRYFPKHSKVKPVLLTPPALVDDDDLEDFPAIA